MPPIAEYDYADFESSQQTEQDAKLLVKFYHKSVKDKARSEDEGRPIFKEREYIDIRIPGSRDGAARPASYRDKQRFPKHYQAFKQRIELPEEGTPLTEWGGVTRSLAEELAFSNIKTVEQLAAVPDSLAGGMMGGMTLKTKATAWLERCKEDVSLERLEGELQSRDMLLDSLQQQLTDLQSRLEVAEINAPPPDEG